MDRETLREQWQANNDRPAWVREHREAIHDHTDTSDRVPEGELHEVRDWLSRFKGEVTKQLTGDDSEDRGEDDAE
jgi:hypothetical protein